MEVRNQRIIKNKYGYNVRIEGIDGKTYVLSNNYSHESYAKYIYDEIQETKDVLKIMLVEANNELLEEI